MRDVPVSRTGILAFAAVVEVATGVFLIVDPAAVIGLLLGVEAAGVAVLLGRFLGIALLALGVACWPVRGAGGAAFRGMLVYNGAVAVFLAWVGAFAAFGGLLLWPAVVLHGAVAMLLIWTGRAPVG